MAADRGALVDHGDRETGAALPRELAEPASRSQSGESGADDHNLSRAVRHHSTLHRPRSALQARPPAAGRRNAFGSLGRTMSRVSWVLRMALVVGAGALLLTAITVAVAPRLWRIANAHEETPVELPDFAAFALLDDAEGRAALVRYFERYAELAVRDGVGMVLETPTWRASADCPWTATSSAPRPATARQ